MISFGEKNFGFGLMRLPMLDGDHVDVEQVKGMVDMFIERGFTYFDTAWMYCNFQSEGATKEFLVDRYPRDAFTLTTKLHSGFINSLEDRDNIFNTQREKCGVEFFDYYLLHDMGEDSYKKYEKFDCFNWIMDKKEQGLVKHIGFSFHSTADVLDKILIEHPEMEFVQLQLNYLDWDSEGIQSRKCYEVCKKHNKPVIVMEPVKGGTLVNVPEAVEEHFKAKDPNMSVASWAIRFAASHENVKMVLSGMGNIDMVDDNTSYMKDFVPLTDEEKEYVLEAADIINKGITIPCTACEYCVPGCPKQIPIPKYFDLYNADLQEFEGKGWNPQGTYYARLTENNSKASDCIECGQCEKACPQHLEIIKYLKDVAKHFEG